ncbi:hypothetical protein Tsubulata_000334 [Turnera subulata]|uniref:BHLH domain-containing protein n=1 Tax=Turnera subulata TaxID=218843 RepID=A0A9Q0F0U7_9ROSI|nr:hypothetical protein Tsubulata_000334 [Turnera subulata]
MEPANQLHPRHQLQEEFSEYYSSLLSQPAEYKVSSSTIDFNPGTFLNIDSGNCRKYATDSSPNSSVSWPPTRDSRTMSTHQGLSFWDAASYGFTEQSANELLHSKIKEEMPDSFPKLSELLYNGEESLFQPTKLKQQFSNNSNSLGENCWLISSNFSSGHNTTELQLSGPDHQLYSHQLPQSSPSLESPSASSRYNNYSHIAPAGLNISTPPDLCFSLVSSSLDHFKLRAADLLIPKYDGSCSSQRTQNNLGHFMQDTKDTQSSSSSKKSVFEDGVGRKKRNSSSLSQSKNSLPEAKKHRSPPQTSIPPLKIRKEKLGDRIAALQRLVAPYGKTDTASVLTEAIGYIQFLHDQVQMGSSEEDGKGQPKRELKSRGLCLVPLSYASFFTSYNSGI